MVSSYGVSEGSRNSKSPFSLLIVRSGAGAERVWRVIKSLPHFSSEPVSGNPVPMIGIDSTGVLGALEWTKI